MESRPTLYVVGGLPATGKTTVSRALARHLSAAYVRIDTIEAAIVAQSDLDHPLGAVGYGVGYRVAADQLAVGLDTVAESVNPIMITRDAWRDLASESRAAVVEIEIICSDPDEHYRRASTRVLDIEDLDGPTWLEIQERDYQPWTRDRLVIDTARLSPDEAVARILSR